jgi:hypothetical protein
MGAPCDRQDHVGPALVALASMLVLLVADVVVPLRAKRPGRQGHPFFDRLAVELGGMIQGD